MEAARSGRSTSYAGLVPSTEAASRVGRGNTRRDTAPERLLRSSLWRLGLRFRVDYDELSGRPDVAFPGSRVAVFCDGDFWHGRDWRRLRRKLERGANGDYWVWKIKRNRERDRRVTRELHRLGWRVLRVWESDVKADPRSVAREIGKVVRRPGS